MLEILGRVSEEYSWFVHNRSLIGGETSAYQIKGEVIWRPGELQGNWTSPMHFHANSILIKRTALDSVGGWPGLNANEDLALVLFLNNEHKT